MRIYLVQINCLGERRYEMRCAPSSCAAIVNALDRYPRACMVSARRIGGAA